MPGLVEKSAYEQLWRDHISTLPADHHEYYIYHKRRYYELFERMAFFTQGLSHPTVLEIGVSGFTRFYKKLFPHISLVTIDRPVTMYGEGEDFAVNQCGADRHYNINLNTQPLTPMLGNPPLGAFDYIIFCEILEHLLINHVQLMEELFSLLRPNGILYLTTPNFFSIHRLRQIMQRSHPQATFPRREGDNAASTHFREYTMAELMEAVAQAGGQLVEAAYSDCWEDEPTQQALAHTPALRSNLVIAACRAGADVKFEAVRSVPQPGGLTDAELAVIGLNSSLASRLASHAPGLARPKPNTGWIRWVRQLIRRVGRRV